MAYSFAIQWLALRHKWLGREYFAFAGGLHFYLQHPRFKPSKNLLLPYPILA